VIDGRHAGGARDQVQLTAAQILERRRLRRGAENALNAFTARM
jgi:hypothetical protein